LQDRSNILISPFGMSPKAIVAVKTPIEPFSLDHEEDEGYHSAKSDSVDQLLNGDWKPNFDVDLEDEETTEVASNGIDLQSWNTLTEPTILASQASSTESSKAYKYTEADVAAMKAQWMMEAQQEREAQIAKHAETESAYSELQTKEGEYMALISEYEKTVTALEEEKKTRDGSNLEAYAHQLSELELSNTRLRTERQEIETSFQQLHKRYEQLKTLQANAIKNEAVLKQTLAKSQADLMAAEARFLRLKSHAQTQLDAANAEINRIREESMKKNLLLAAKLSLCQVQLASLSVEHELSKGENQTLQTIVSDLCSQLQPSSILGSSLSAM
jgi:DNA repair exonuclease SbcCD ATPase subunit